MWRGRRLRVHRTVIASCVCYKARRDFTGLTAALQATCIMSQNGKMTENVNCGMRYLAG
ncbi:hypothetical protein SZ54_0555 [Rhizobium sp. UR51a]|nr:hypothetical protein SZ54_0555 [Rhizobium sp. UR51a]